MNDFYGAALAEGFARPGARHTDDLRGRRRAVGIIVDDDVERAAGIRPTALYIGGMGARTSTSTTRCSPGWATRPRRSVIQDHYLQARRTRRPPPYRRQLDRADRADRARRRRSRRPRGVARLRSSAATPRRCGGRGDRARPSCARRRRRAPTPATIRAAMQRTAPLVAALRCVLALPAGTASAAATPRRLSRRPPTASSRRGRR